MAIDLAATNNFSHTLTENTTLVALSNPTAGQSGEHRFHAACFVTQDAGLQQLWKFSGGTVPSPQRPRAVDVSRTVWRWLCRLQPHHRT